MNISIIICTMNRSTGIINTLDSIAQAQSHTKSDIKAEIIIIDNNSTDDTHQVVQDWISAHPNSNAKIFMEQKRGLSHARNCGIKHAGGDLVIFTDDDCCLNDDYLQKAAELYLKDEELVLRGGDVQLGNPDDFPTSIRTNTEFVEFSLKENTARTANLGPLLMGCNMMMPKKLIDKIGEFDTRFGAGTNIYGGEDTDYIFRAYLEGAPVQYVPGLTIHHYHGRTKEDATQLRKNYTIGIGALNMKYLFRHFNFTRQTWWDAKKLLKEILTGKNLYAPELNVSYKIAFYYLAIGAWRYIWVSTKRIFRLKS